MKRRANPRWRRLNRGAVLVPVLVRTLSLALAGSFAAQTVAAHDGSHVSRLVSDVGMISVQGARLGFELVVSNHSDHEVTLIGIAARDAQVAPMAPVQIAPRAQQALDVTLFFTTAVPGIFTVVLDFGDAGQGPVLVMPQNKEVR